MPVILMYSTYDKIGWDIVIYLQHTQRMTTEIIIRTAVILIIFVILIRYFWNTTPTKPQQSPLQSYSPVAIPFQLETTRLLIRDVVSDDFEPMLAYLSDPDVHKYMLPHQESPPYIQWNIEQSIQAAHYHPRVRYGLAIVDKEMKSVIGSCMVQIEPGSQNATIGWDIMKCKWKQGYATEAALAVVQWLFEHTDVELVTAECHENNKASMRVMEKLGMLRETLDPTVALRGYSNNQAGLARRRSIIRIEAK